MSLALSWSGGKDSALALRALRAEGDEPCALFTTLTDGFDRISMHGVRRSLLVRQAEAVGVPLVEIRIPPACVNEVYEERIARAFDAPPLRDVEGVAFGDLFLEDVRSYREGQLARAGKEGIFPLWGSDTAALAHEFVDADFRAAIVCVDPRRLDPSWAGRAYDASFLADLPGDVDPCGENGEFHTFVYSGPVFTEAVALEVGDVLERDGFVFCDLVASG